MKPISQELINCANAIEKYVYKELLDSIENPKGKTMKIQIYGAPQCSFCTQAKQLCETNNVEYDYKSLGSDFTVAQLQEMVGQPVRSIPQIFITEGGFSEYVGGYNELKAKLEGMGIN